MTNTHHEFALLVALAMIAAPALLCGAWVLGRKWARRAARREMARRNRICYEWMKNGGSGQA
jgi:hypothetical protein